MRRAVSPGPSATCCRPPLAWGIGLGIYGVLMAAASRSLLDELSASPAMAEIFRTIIPGIDITTAAGFLQLAFADIGFVLIGLATVTFIAARSSDETAGRLELQLTTPLTRARWAVASGLAVGLAIALVTVLLAAAVALGVASVGQDPVTAATGTIVLAVYGAALAGVGVAVAGVWRASLAMPAVLAMSIGTFLLDLLAPILRLPDWVGQLALTAPSASHGRPVGCGRVVACLVLAVLGSPSEPGGWPAATWADDGGAAMTDRPAARRWLLLIYRVKAESSGRRTYVWRQLRQLGAVYLQQAAAVVPDRPELRVELDRLGQRIRGAGGEASLIESPRRTAPGGTSWWPAQRRPNASSTRSSTAWRLSRMRSVARRARSASARRLEESETNGRARALVRPPDRARLLRGAGFERRRGGLARGRTLLDDFHPRGLPLEGLGPTQPQVQDGPE